MSYLLDGLRNGFDTGIHPLPSRATEFNNLWSARNNSTFVSSAIESERQKGFLIGPFSQPPFPIYRVNPIGVATRKFSGKQRLIVDCSWPHNNDSSSHTNYDNRIPPDTSSINDLISKEEYSLKYVKLDDALKVLANLGPGCKLCKTDIQDAFKIIPLRPDLVPYYGIKWDNKYYFFTRLCFGCRSSPKIFDMLSRAIQFIATNNYGISMMFHLLDDFLTIDPPGADAERSMAILTLLFNRLQIPYHHDKTLGPESTLVWLGLEIDCDMQELRLDAVKLQRINSVINKYYKRKYCQKRELLSVLGHLTFAARAAKLGRSFTSRIISAAYSKPHLFDWIKITSEVRADLNIWQQILKQWNGVSYITPEITASNSELIVTDAAGSGYAGYYFRTGQWFQSSWPGHLQLPVDSELSIAFQELYPIVVACLLFGDQWTHKNVLFLCDNSAAVHVINKGRSKSPKVMQLVRRLVLLATCKGFNYASMHLKGILNDTADSLSRFQMARFRSLQPNAAVQPLTCPLPPEVMDS